MMETQSLLRDIFNSLEDKLERLTFRPCLDIVNSDCCIGSRVSVGELLVTLEPYVGLPAEIAGNSLYSEMLLTGKKEKKESFKL